MSAVIGGHAKIFHRYDAVRARGFRLCGFQQWNPAILKRRDRRYESVGPLSFGIASDGE
jgi:hypothetical protein